MPRLPILIRQNKVFELVVAGRSYAQISQQLGMSEDTIARDMAAIGDEVKAIAQTRLGEVVAVALAQYQAVLDEAWREYRAAARRETAWYRGEMDYQTTTVVVKTLAATGGTAGADDDDDDEELGEQSAPLEVKTTRRSVRPALVGTDRRTWLALIVETTREITELLGVRKQIVQHEGGATPIGHVHLSLEEWKQQAAERRAQAEQTYTLLDDDAQ